MKTKIFLLGFLLSLAVIGCSKDDSTSSSSTEDATVNAKIDDATDDVSKIVDDQSNRQENASRGTADAPASFLPSCATVTLTTTETTWTRVVDFGTEGCAMPNGNILKGKIIISGSKNFDLPSLTISYGFENFYHNSILVEGNRTVVRTKESTAAQATIHPVATMSLNMSLTFPNGNVYTRVGTRVREMVEGFTTPMIWTDNVFSISGNWSTSFPNGGSQVSTITSPLLLKMTCNHISKGIVSFTRNNITGTLDYGDGTCDNLAVVTINGVSHNITLGN